MGGVTVYKVGKLFNRHISIRDYVVEENAKNDRSIRVVFKDQNMVLSPQDLRTKGKKAGLQLRSAWGDKTYDLIDFDWEPGSEALKLFD